MSSFSLHIATDNAAFHDEEGEHYSAATGEELARILRDVADRLPLLRARDADDPVTVRDSNGNTCGRWSWTDRDATHDDAAALERIAHLCEHSTSLPPGLSFLAAIADVVRDTGRKVAP